MKINRNQLTTAVRSGLFAVMAAGLASTPLTVFAQDDAEEEEGVKT